MIRIVSDSSTLYSVKEGKERNIDIAPLLVTINHKSYKEFEEITSDKFLSLINEGHMPSSSQPSVGEVLDIYSSYPEDEIINISMADGLSGTYNSACMAARMMDHSDNITVINSKTLCGPQRYMVDTAVNMAESGYSREEIVNTISEMADNSYSFLIPRDFMYLVRGGRLSSLAGHIGGIMKIVPVLALSKDGGSLNKFATKRTFSKAINKICDNMKENFVDKNYRAYITCSGEENLAISAKKIILESIELNEEDIEIMELSPAFITQGGPGAMAIQFIRKNDILIK